MLTAEQIMKEHRVSVSPETSLGKAIELMLEENANFLLILSDNGQLVGIVPGSVLLRAALDSHIRHDPVSLHMTRHFMSVEVQAPIDAVIDQFILHRLDYLPVVDGGRIAGLIHWQDVLRASFGKSLVNQGVAV